MIARLHPWPQMSTSHTEEFWHRRGDRRTRRYREVANERNIPANRLIAMRHRYAPPKHEEPHDRATRCPLRSSSSVLDLKMSIHRLIIPSAAVLTVSASCTYAGPCSRCRLACATGLSLPQSVGAMKHRQPTRGSVAAAEKKLASMACGSARLRRRAHH